MLRRVWGSAPGERFERLVLREPEAGGRIADFDPQDLTVPPSRSDDHFEIDLRSGDGCRLIGYQHSRGGTFRALCRCGWESLPCPSAGMAGSAHEAHIAEEAHEPQV